MKKLISIIMAMVMTVAIGINVLAAESTEAKPEIKVYTSAVPKKSEDEAAFTVKLTDFDGVQGVKLTITADSGIKFTGVVGDENLTLTKDSNFTLSEQKIVIADLTKTITNAEFKITATAIADAKITLAADLAKNGKNLYGASEFTLTNGTVLVKPSVQNATAGTTIKDETDYFIPYGSLGYEDGGEFVSITKNDDGSFTVPENATGATYSQYKKATNGVMTFGYSDKKRGTEPAYQFGSWVNKTKGTSYGTMVIAGDYTEIMNYFKNSKNKTEKEFLEKISAVYDANYVEGKLYVKMNCTVAEDDVKSIRVYKFENKTAMWENETERQFALQIYNLKIGEEYVGIAYSINETETNKPTTTFSETAQYVEYK